MEPKFPNRIWDLLSDRGLSLREMQVKTGNKISHTKLNRLANGDTPMVFDDARIIADTLGIPISALLNDEDVEFRPDAYGQLLLDALRDVPAADRPDVLAAARAVAKAARNIAVGHSGLHGDEATITELSEAWNSFRPEQLPEAIDLLVRLKRFGKDGTGA